MYCEWSLRARILCCKQKKRIRNWWGACQRTKSYNNSNGEHIPPITRTSKASSKASAPLPPDAAAAVPKTVDEQIWQILRSECVSRVQEGTIMPAPDTSRPDMAQGLGTLSQATSIHTIPADGGSWNVLPAISTNVEKTPRAAPAISDERDTVIAQMLGQVLHIASWESAT